MIATHVTSRPREPRTDVDEVQPLSAEDQQLFAELHDVLKRHGALKRFGITLLHQHFEIADDEVLLEQTDKVTRRQLIEPVKVSTLQDLQPIETSWRLDSGEPMMRCVCVTDPNNNHTHVYWPNGDD
jgi:hypothetical protein